MLYVWGSVVVLFLKKPGLVWPARDEVVSATIAVGFAVVIFSVLVSLLDTVLVKLLSYIIG